MPRQILKSTRTVSAARTVLGSSRSGVSTIPRKPNLPVGFFQKEAVPGATGSSQSQFAAGMMHNNVIWAATFYGLYSSVDYGQNWVLKDNLNGNYSVSGVEGLFITSANVIYIASTNDQKILTSTINPATNALPSSSSFTYVTLQDGITPFVYPADNGQATGGHFNNWSCWEIEQSYEAVGGLNIGDVVFSHYHRVSSGKHQRLAFIYRMRGGMMDAVADTTIQAAKTIYIPDPNNDPFKNWNTSEAYSRRHIHNALMGKDGYLYFSSGDSLISYNIDSVTGAGTGLVTINCAEHGCVTGMVVTIAGNTASALNKAWTITKVDIDNFTLNGSDWSLQGSGTGGTITPNISINVLSGDDYHLQRIKPDSTGAAGWEFIAGDIHGYTSLIFDADGNLMAGNDYASGGVGGRMTIDKYAGTQFLRNVYSPPAYYDWPIWDFVQLEGTRRFFAAIQRMGGAIANTSRAGLLYSSDDGDTWTRIVESSGLPAGAQWIDIDRIYSSRHRTIPPIYKNLVIQVQPEAGTNNYFLYCLDTSVSNIINSMGNLKIWFSADSITTLSDGTGVSSWTDNSVNANTASQATGNLQPLYKTNILNGMPIVRFDGAVGANADYLSLGSSVATTNLTIFAVYKTPATNNNNVILGATTGGVYCGGLTTLGVGLYDGGYLTGSKPTTWTLVSINNNRIYVNGSESAYTNYKKIGNLTFDTIGRRTVADSSAFGGDLAELLVFKEVLSVYSRRYIEKYLADKYGLTLS